jgi:hypothetical protein
VGRLMVGQEQDAERLGRDRRQLGRLVHR